MSRYGKRIKLPHNNRRAQAGWRIVVIFSLVLVVVLAYRQNLFEGASLKVDWHLDPRIPTSTATLDALAAPYLTPFVAPPILRLKTELESLPWVKNARVSRASWSTLAVLLEAHKIGYRWHDIASGKRGYISTDGVLFIPLDGAIGGNKNDETLADTPHLISPGNAIDTRELVTDFESYLIAAKPLEVLSLARGEVDTLGLKQGVQVVLGNRLQIERIATFKAGYKRLSEEGGPPQNIIFDMRYPKGFTTRPVK